MELRNRKSLIIELYEAWDKPEKAEKWRAKLPQIEAKIESDVATENGPNFRPSVTTARTT